MRIFVIIFVILTRLTVVNGQTYLITYVSHSKPVSLNSLPSYVVNNPASLKAYLKGKERKYTYELKHSDGLSIYTAQYSMLDGVMDEEKKHLSSSIVYKDFTKGYFVMTGKFVGPKKAVKESLATFFNWTIQPQSDSLIAGFHCQKATTIFRDDLVTVWFTNKIPIIDGPDLFAGVPGLIILLDTKKSRTEVEEIKIVEHVETIAFPKISEYVSFKKYLKDRLKYID